MPLSAAPFDLEIRSFGDKSLIYCLSVKWYTSVKDIKDDLNKILNLPPSRLLLFFASSSKPLRNSARLIDLGIDEEGYSLHLEMSKTVGFDSRAVELEPMRESFDDLACKQMIMQVSMGLKNHKPTSTDVLDCTGGVYFMKDPKGAKVAVFKPCDEEQGMPNNGKGHAGNGERGLRPYFTPGYGHIRETAAYLFDHENFCQVPATTIVHCENPVFHYPRGQGGYRRLSPKVGSLQSFVRSGTDSFEDISPSLISTFELQKIALLDMRLLNSDRNASNILLIPKPYHQQVMMSGRRNSRTGSMGSCNSEHDADDCEVEFVDDHDSSSVVGFGSSYASVTSHTHHFQSKDQYELIPIDHGYCFPTKLHINEWDWSWLYTSHMSKEVDPEIKRYMRSLDIDELIHTVSNQVDLHPDTVFLLRVAHKVILDGIEAGLTLRQIAELMCRLDEDIPSPLERLIEIAEDNAFQTIESRIGANFFQKGNFQSRLQHQRTSFSGSSKKNSPIPGASSLKKSKGDPPLSTISPSSASLSPLISLPLPESLSPPHKDIMINSVDPRQRRAGNLQSTMSASVPASSGRVTPTGTSGTAVEDTPQYSPPKADLKSPVNHMKLRRIVESEADLESLSSMRGSTSSLFNSPPKPAPAAVARRNFTGPTNKPAGFPSPLKIALGNSSGSLEGVAHRSPRLASHKSSPANGGTMTPSSSNEYFMCDLSDANSDCATPVPTIRESDENSTSSGGEAEESSAKPERDLDTAGGGADVNYVPGLSLVNPRHSFAGQSLTKIETLDETQLSGSGTHSSKSHFPFKNIVHENLTASYSSNDTTTAAVTAPDSASIVATKTSGSSENIRLASGEMTATSAVSALSEDTELELHSTSYLHTFMRNNSSSKAGDLVENTITSPSKSLHVKVCKSDSNDEDKGVTTSEELLSYPQDDSPTAETPTSASLRAGMNGEKGKFNFSISNSVDSSSTTASDEEDVKTRVVSSHQLAVNTANTVHSSTIYKRSSRIASFTPPYPSSSSQEAASAPPEGSEPTSPAGLTEVSSDTSNERLVEQQLRATSYMSGRELRTVTADPFSPQSFSTFSPGGGDSSSASSATWEQKRASYTPNTPIPSGGNKTVVQSLFVAGNDPSLAPVDTRHRNLSLTSEGEGQGTSSEDGGGGDEYEGEDDSGGKKKSGANSSIAAAAPAPARGITSGNDGKPHRVRHSFSTSTTMGSTEKEAVKYAATAVKAPKTLHDNHMANTLDSAAILSTNEGTHGSASSHIVDSFDFNKTMAVPASPFNFNMPPPVAISRAISFGAFSTTVPASANSESDKPGRQLARLRREKRRHTARSPEFQDLRGNFALSAVHSMISKVSNKRSPARSFDM